MKRSGFKRRYKYGNIPISIDGIKWPSILQGNHYKELKLLQAGKIIKDLDWEVDFPLKLEGALIATYRADFTFFHIGRNKNVILESKGKQTDLFKLKWKLCKILYPEYDYELATEKSLCHLINSET